jgi:protein-disulfide isomerase
LRKFFILTVLTASLLAGGLLFAAENSAIKEGGKEGGAAATLASPSSPDAALAMHPATLETVPVSSNPMPTKVDATKTEAAKDSGVVLTDHVMGDPAAPVTIIEYASLTCGHCAHFYKDVLPQVEKNFIATGKVKLIYRHFPLNATALKASQLAHCLPEERFFPFIKTLFENLDKWGMSQDPDAALAQYAKLAGLTQENIDTCLADKKLQDAIVKHRMEAENKFRVQATPTFIISIGAAENKDRIEGAADYASFAKTLQKYVK